MRRELAERVVEVFEAWGYARVITPGFEHAEVLERGLGAGARAAAIRFVEPGTGEVVALRPDITPQIARLVATRMADVPGPIRLGYEGAVYRLGRHAGEIGQREIIQAGIELYDAPAPDGDAEVLAVAAAALARIGLGEVRLDVGHVAPAACVLDAASELDARGASEQGITAREALAAALARKDRAGVRAAARALPGEFGKLAEALATLYGPAHATLERALALPWPERVHTALGELSAVLDAFAVLVEPPAPPLVLELGDLRGFDYYTGVRFAAYAAGAGEAVLRGGLYDELHRRYGHARPATGFAIDLEAVAEVHATEPHRATGFAIHGAGAAELARALRGGGLRATVERRVQADWPRWLRGAGLDAALVHDQLIDARTGNQRAAGAAINAALAGDTAALIALIRNP